MFIHCTKSDSTYLIAIQYLVYVGCLFGFDVWLLGETFIKMKINNFN